MVHLDKFYTNPDVVDECISLVGDNYEWDWDLVVEPSAGCGNFLVKIPTTKKVGLDIEPEHPDVVLQDFYTYTPPTTAKNVLVVGNPPFGRVCSDAVKFFNHSAKWATVIAFIIPKTFRRISVQNRLSPNFKLVHDSDIREKPCAFTPKMAVKCCFQIWERTEVPRAQEHLETSHPDWDFMKMGPKDDVGQPTPPVGADFAIRAYGGKCGEIRTENLEDLRPKSWHWIRAKIPVQELISNFQSLDYSVSLDTARQNSIGRGELVKIYAHAHNTDTLNA